MNNPLGDKVSGIVASDVTVTYRNGHTALRNASFEVPRGTITALVGVNGGGKSTLFKAIMGFVRVQKGRVSVLGMGVSEALKKNLIAYVPQAEEVDWSFPVLVEDVVMMGRYGHMGFLRRPGQADRDAVRASLARVGMGDFAQRQIGELSGGQKKRVFLARALAQDAQVILLDEPFTGVDVTTEETIIALLGELRAEGRVMLVATHNLGSVPEFCDRVVLVKGTVLDYGPTESVFTQANLERTFGGVLRHFVLPDEDGLPRRIVTDDERPLVFHGEVHTQRRADPTGDSGAKGADPGGPAAHPPAATAGCGEPAASAEDRAADGVKDHVAGQTVEDPVAKRMAREHALPPRPRSDGPDTQPPAPAGVGEQKGG